MTINDFKQSPFMGILRGVKAEHIEPLVNAIISSGLKTVEITMNTPDACNLIKQMVKLADNRLHIGAGTVLRMEEMHAALDAGASFIVSPTLVENIVHYCDNNDILVFPGAFSPQEIYNAWCCGATMVKVFPSKFFGADYIKEIKGPFQDIELMACGGVNANNIGNFFACGASAVAFGASVFKPELLKASDFLGIEKNIKTLIGK